METEKIIKRSEQKKEDTWALEDIFATDEEWFEELQNCEKFISEISKFKGTLSQSAQQLYKFLSFSDDMTIRLEALANYAFRRNDEDQSNSFYIDMRGKIMSLYTKISGASAFETPELIAIDDATLDAFYKELPELELYRRAIDKERLLKAHILSESEEKILALSTQLAQAPENINSVFMNADIKFPSVTDSNGKGYVLTQGTFINLLHSQDRLLRENTFKALYQTLNSFGNTIAATLDGQMRQLKFFADIRKYPSTMEASLSRTEVPCEVYENLISTVHDNLDKMYKYVALRKKLMGVDELHMYDIYCPIVSEINKEITFEAAKENVLNGLAVLGDNYTELLKKGFNERWIDIYENEGKRSGAYSAGGRPHPYVLLNHKNNIDSQFTLAHEMGHALHTYFSMKNQPTVYSDYVIFVAEVASTCNEVLVMKYLLGKTIDKKERAYLINYFLEQFRTTMYRQTMFAEFELDINRMCAKGESLTADLLNERYYELNKLYYGENIVIDDDIKLEWARIPHFFYDYYVFQYATGFAAAVAIADRITKEGKRAVDDYLCFLSGGCSKDPISLLKLAGVDMASPEPINKALAMFDSLIDEMEALFE